jgi:hypothetical protein
MVVGHAIRSKEQRAPLAAVSLLSQVIRLSRRSAKATYAAS